MGKFANLKLHFETSDNSEFGHDLSQQLTDLINLAMLNQNIFDIIEEDFERGISAGVPIIDLLVINCVMAALEHHVTVISSIIPNICLQRHNLLIKN